MWWVTIRKFRITAFSGRIAWSWGTVEPYCIIGANAMVREGVTIATGCIIGAGALITRNTRPGSVYLAPASELVPGSSAELSALLEAR